MEIILVLLLGIGCGITTILLGMSMLCFCAERNKTLEGVLFLLGAFLIGFLTGLVLNKIDWDKYQPCKIQTKRVQQLQVDTIYTTIRENTDTTYVIHYVE